MKRLIASFVGACLLMASGIAHASEKVMYQLVTDNKPDVGVSATVYLGDRMLEQRIGQWQECIVPKFSEEKKVAMGMAAIFIKAGQPLCKKSQDSKDGYWSITYDAYVYYVKGGGGYRSPVKLKNKNKSIQPCISSACFKVRQPNDFENEPYFVYSENTFQQTIEYGGRSGDVLKFTYSEFTDGFARQAFTREFQVDLTQGKVAAYKGAIIEIESATNSSITYKVVRNFQQ
jgi:hypothetical protein